MNKNIFIIIIILFSLLYTSCSKNEVEIYKDKKQEEKIVISEYYEAIELFNKVEYNELIEKLNLIIKKYGNIIDNHNIYSFSYFMLGFVYEKKYVESTDIAYGDLSLLNYNKYIKLKKHQEYVFRAYEGTARIYYYQNLKKYSDKICQNILLSLKIKKTGSAYRLLANLYLYNKKYSEALKNYKLAIQIEPNNEWNFIGKGTALFYLNKINKAKAIEAYKTALKINPKNEKAKYNISILTNKK